MGKQPIEVFMPPNVLKAKVGGDGVTALDLSALKRAEKAIEDLKEEFVEWINVDVGKLATARDLYAQNHDMSGLKSIYRAAHDLKGQGTTFDFPLVTRIASSLCDLTECEDGREPPVNLVDAHVDAIKIVVRQNIRDATNKMAVILSSELESRVAGFLENKH